MRKLVFLLLALLAVSGVEASVRMPQLFQSGMVLQRGKPVPVWGWAGAGEQVSVVFKKKVYSATADAEGRWQVMLPAQKAGGPFTITVKGADASELLIEDVLFGDV